MSSRDININSLTEICAKNVDGLLSYTGPVCLKETMDLLAVGASVFEPKLLERLIWLNVLIGETVLILKMLLLT